MLGVIFGASPHPPFGTLIGETCYCRLISVSRAGLAETITQAKLDYNGNFYWIKIKKTPLLEKWLFLP